MFLSKKTHNPNFPTTIVVVKIWWSKSRLTDNIVCHLKKKNKGEQPKKKN